MDGAVHYPLYLSGDGLGDAMPSISHITGNRPISIYRMSSSSHAYPMKPEQKAEAYCKFLAVCLRMNVWKCLTNEMFLSP